MRDEASVDRGMVLDGTKNRPFFYLMRSDASLPWSCVDNNVVMV
jgi:hypothetical protein